MLTMAAAAVYLAILKQQRPNILAGVLAFYLITTGWLTARRGDGQTSGFDWGILLIPLAGGSWLGFTGLEKLFSHTPPNDGVPIGMDFFVASVMLLAAAGDVSMMVRSGLFGTKFGAAFVAHVLWTVYRHRVLFSGTTTSLSRRVARFDPPDCPGVPATGLADFLVFPGSLHKRIQGEVDTACIGR